MERDFRWLVALEAASFFSAPCWELTASWARPLADPVGYLGALVGTAVFAMLACHIGPAFAARSLLRIPESGGVGRSDLPHHLVLALVCVRAPVALIRFPQIRRSRAARNCAVADAVSSGYGCRSLGGAGVFGRCNGHILGGNRRHKPAFRRHPASNSLSTLYPSDIASDHTGRGHSLDDRSNGPKRRGSLAERDTWGAGALVAVRGLRRTRLRGREQFGDWVAQVEVATCLLPGLLTALRLLAGPLGALRHRWLFLIATPPLTVLALGLALVRGTLPFFHAAAMVSEFHVWCSGLVILGGTATGFAALSQPGKARNE